MKPWTYLYFFLRLSKMSTNKNHDQASIAVLEKKLKEEEGGRQRVEAELREHLNSIQNLCSEEEVFELREKLSAKERELESTRKELQQKQRQVDQLQFELGTCHASLQGIEKEKAQLSMSLAEEAAVKMRLFKALSDSSHKHQSYAEELQRKKLEIDHLRQRLAEIMAIVPALPTPPVHRTPTTAPPFQPTTMAPFGSPTTAFTPTSIATFPPPSLSPPGGHFPPPPPPPHSQS